MPLAKNTIQARGALNYLRSQSPPIIHRDVKPQNIKITPDDRAVLVDFGIAKEYIAGEKTLAGAQARCWLDQSVSSAGILLFYKEVSYEKSTSTH